MPECFDYIPQDIVCFFFDGKTVVCLMRIQIIDYELFFNRRYSSPYILAVIDLDSKKPS